MPAPTFTCPKCGRETGVKETRSYVSYIRRRRICLDYKCTGRLTTVEIAHPGTDFQGLVDPVIISRRRIEGLIKQTQSFLRLGDDGDSDDEDDQDLR